VLGEDLSLPPVFQSDLSDFLRLLVVTQSSAFDETGGHFVADRLAPFIQRARHLLQGDAAKNWTPQDLARTRLILGDALRTVGDQSGDNGALNEAIDQYNAALTGFTLAKYPLDWALTQNNLGVTLRNLGERESGTQHLAEAVAAFRAALEEYTRVRMPLRWATTQNNLGGARWRTRTVWASR
jgi:tetratricopeptide (TPR) repeat protein